MIFIYILIGLGLGLAQQWPNSIPSGKDVDLPKLIDYDLGVALSAYIYYKLCMKVPDQAVSWLTGRLSLGFDTATDVKAGVKAVVAAPGKLAETAVKTADKAAGVARGMQGMGMAMEFAKEKAKVSLAAQGREANRWNMAGETIKTFGSAWGAVKQAEWDKKMNDTTGGKMATDIVTNMNATKGDAKTQTKTKTAK
jgi:hypothetical protein